MDCRIERIEIVSFGKLQNFVLELQSGLNVLNAPNESGKSTLAAFLRFAFYGFTDGRKKELSENDKKLYTPWDSAKSEGAVTVLRGEKRYRVFRSVSGNKETCTVTELATGKQLPDGEIPGVFLFGVSEEVFGRTLFFKQLTLPAGKDGVMAEQLQNIAVSADEQVSSRRAAERLTKAKNELKGRAGSGLIPKSEQEAVRLENALAEAKRERAEIDELRAGQKKLEDQLVENAVSSERVRAELQNIERYEAAKKLAQLSRIQKESESAETAYSEAKNACKNADPAKMQQILEQYAAYEQACAKAEAAKDALQAGAVQTVSQEPAERKSGMLPTVIGGVALAVGIALLFVLFAVGAAVAAFGAVLLLAGTIKTASAKKEAAARKEAAFRATEEGQTKLRAAYDTAKAWAESLQKEVEASLAVYGIAPDGLCVLSLRALQNACYEAARLQAAAESAARAASIAYEGVDIPALEALAKDAKEPSRERALAERELHFLAEQARLLREKAQKTSNSIAALEGHAADPALLAGKLDAVQRGLAEYRKKYEAYEAARAGIEEAADVMKSMVAPRLAEIAGRYFAVATGGKYRELEVDTRLAMNLRDENGIARESDYLSAGTRDIAYLSLRLALTELLYGMAGVPFVLDDAFGRLDDMRLKNILRALCAAAEKHQILILCCTDREEAALTQAGLPYHALSM